MREWFFILGGLYLAALIFSTIRARRQIQSANDFMMAGKNLGFFLGGWTVAATLFSTYALMGMPDFFRTHGVGAWFFIAVGDCGIAFVIIWFGSQLRRCAASKGFQGMAGLMRDCYESKWAGYLYLIGVFVFLVPYVAIQIRGIGLFMNMAFPGMLPVWGWATIIVAVMLTYSELGGLKAIIYADAIQGMIMVAVTIIIAYGCIRYFGGIADMFEQVEATKEALLSVPGPEGLFTTQFLIASYIVVILVPVTQPQFTIRFVIMRDISALYRTAAFLGLFAIIVVLAIIPLGMYGAVKYSGIPTQEFLGNALIFDQLPIIAAAVAIGLIAAAISTSDSQLFALGNELRSMLSGDEQMKVRRTKLAIFGFAFCALIVAILSGDQLVLIARVSFAGTAILAPFIIAAVASQRRPQKHIITATGLAIIIFLCSVLGLIPDMIGFMRLDLSLILILSAVACLNLRFQRSHKPVSVAK